MDTPILIVPEFQNNPNVEDFNYTLDAILKSDDLLTEIQ